MQKHDPHNLPTATSKSATPQGEATTSIRTQAGEINTRGGDLYQETGNKLYAPAHRAASRSVLYYDFPAKAGVAAAVSGIFHSLDSLVLNNALLESLTDASFFTLGAYAVFTLISLPMSQHHLNSMSTIDNDPQVFKEQLKEHVSTANAGLSAIFLAIGTLGTTIEFFMNETILTGPASGPSFMIGGAVMLLAELPRLINRDVSVKKLLHKLASNMFD